MQSKSNDVGTIISMYKGKRIAKRMRNIERSEVVDTIRMTGESILISKKCERFFLMLPY